MKQEQNTAFIISFRSKKKSTKFGLKLHSILKTIFGERIDICTYSYVPQNTEFPSTQELVDSIKKCLPEWADVSSADLKIGPQIKSSEGTFISHDVLDKICKLAEVREICGDTPLESCHAMKNYSNGILPPIIDTKKLDSIVDIPIATIDAMEAGTLTNTIKDDPQPTVLRVSLEQQLPQKEHDVAEAVSNIVITESNRIAETMKAIARVTELSIQLAKLKIEINKINEKLLNLLIQDDVKIKVKHE